MNAEMDISKNQWRSTGGKTPYLEYWFSNQLEVPKLVESPSMAKRIHWDHDSTETNNTHLIMKWIGSYYVGFPLL